MSTLDILLETIAPVLENIIDNKINRAIDKISSPASMLGEYAGTDSQGKQWVIYDGSDIKSPISWSTIEAAPGDRVSITVQNGKAVMDKNLTNPSAGVKGVEKAELTAQQACEDASKAMMYSELASLSASAAQESADSALSAATDAKTGAANAWNHADSASLAAIDANEKATAATQSASQAQTSADAASIAANEAQESADNARDIASVAQISADIAKTSANSALLNLSEIENVVGAVNWIAEHGRYVSQAGQEFDATKIYYTRVENHFNLAPFFSVPYENGDYWDFTSAMSIDSQTADGWAVDVYANDQVLVKKTNLFQSLSPSFGDAFTLLVEYEGGVDAYIADTDYSGSLQCANSEDRHFTASGDGVRAIPMLFRTSSSYMLNIAFDEAGKVRVSLYQGEYDGPYVPWVDNPRDTYQIVENPVPEDIDSYYLLVIDDSVQNYIATHLALNNEGLHIFGNAGDYNALLGIDGLDIRESGGTSVAKYGEDFRVGKVNGVYLQGTPTRLAFTSSAGDIVYFGLDDQQVWSMFMEQAYVRDMIRFGNYAWVKRANGNLTMKYLED